MLPMLQQKYFYFLNNNAWVNSGVKSVFRDHQRGKTNRKNNQHGDSPSKKYIITLQVKIKFTLKLFNLG